MIDGGDFGQYECDGVYAEDAVRDEGTCTLGLANPDGGTSTVRFATPERVRRMRCFERSEPETREHEADAHA